jgi:hypothetical protein
MSYLLVILAGAVGAYAFKTFIKSDVGDGLLGSLIFAPALVIWLTGQNISEFSAYGITAKINATIQSKASSLNDKIKTLVINASSVDDPTFEKSATFELCADFIAFRPEHVPPEGADRDRYIFNLTYTIRTSISCGRFVGAVVLDKDDRYLGSFSKSFFSEASALWASWSPLTGDKASIAKRILSTTVFGAALIYPKERVATIEGFVAAISVDATVATAYARLGELNVDFLVLTTPIGKYQGIVTRRSVIEKIVAGLIQ